MNIHWIINLIQAGWTIRMYNRLQDLTDRKGPKIVIKICLPHFKQLIVQPNEICWKYRCLVHLQMNGLVHFHSQIYSRFTEYSIFTPLVRRIHGWNPTSLAEHRSFIYLFNSPTWIIHRIKFSNGYPGFKSEGTLGSCQGCPGFMSQGALEFKSRVPWNSSRGCPGFKSRVP